MKKQMVFVILGLLVSAVLFAQTTQDAENARTTGAAEYDQYDQYEVQGTQDFGRGGYTGTRLTPIEISDLLSQAPNAYVIVSGYIIGQRVPGTFVLADDPDDPQVSVVVYLNDYFWVNLQIDPSTPVLVYGTASRSDLRTEIIGERVEVQGGQ
ncbi:MAG: hypothetical protein LBS57_01020 [Treponema sp.]|jgi:uncharacterized protein YdeI (BOF family)|nr:hypothetical protein [Treponema sp.]